MKGQYKNNLDGGTPADPAFKGIGRTSTAFLIWRVQNLQLVPVPREQYGTFYSGDSYIVYAASEYGKHVNPHTKPREIKGKIEMHIHFWLGSATSQDESAVAAFKTVELDNYLGGKPVQHREVMGNESARFKAYFKNGIRTCQEYKDDCFDPLKWKTEFTQAALISLYELRLVTTRVSKTVQTSLRRILIGGYESGLKSLNNTFEPRLFRIKGRRRPVVTQMPGVSWEYFNSGDVFIIDTKDVVFLWIGRTSNSMERLLGAKVATQFRDERNALSIVFVDDGREMEMPTPEQTLLGFYLDLRPLAKRVMSEATEADDKVEQDVRSALKLYRCSDSDGIYKVTEVKTGKLSQADLDPKDSYIIDNGPHHIWVWIGREASSKERVEAMRNANGFLKKKNYPLTCRVSRIVDGGEPTEFKSLFPLWKDRESIPNSKTNSNAPGIKPPPLTGLKLTSLEKNPLMAAQEQLLDDGSGNLIVWRIAKSHLEEVVNKHVLYSSEMYYASYTYTYNGETKDILYHWVGSQAGDMPAKTLLTLSQEDPITKANVRARIIQNYEPPHFLTAFKGKLVVMNGDHQECLPKTYLLQVQGNQIFNSYAKQRPLQKSSLNSSHVYLLKTEFDSYLWCGRASTGDEREVAKNIALTFVKGEFSVIFEGQEKKEFWDHLCGEEEYSTHRETDSISDRHHGRLFHCLRHKNSLKVEEVVDFTQSDLSPEDFFLLDASHSVFLWIGKHAHREDKTKALETALEYLKTDPANRDIHIPIIWMKQGYEPPLFTGFFHDWDPQMWQKEQKFEEVRSEIDSQKPLLQVDLIVTDNIPNFYECDKYPLSVLLERDPEKLPVGVDVQHKELYLSSEDFFDVFSMKYSEFSTIPKWKQEYLKKNVGLF